MDSKKDSCYLCQSDYKLSRCDVCIRLTCQGCMVKRNDYFGNANFIFCKKCNEQCSDHLGKENYDYCKECTKIGKN